MKIPWVPATSWYCVFVNRCNFVDLYFDFWRYKNKGCIGSPFPIYHYANKEYLWKSDFIKSSKNSAVHYISPPNHGRVCNRPAGELEHLHTSVSSSAISYNQHAASWREGEYVYLLSSLAPTRWFIKWKKDFIVVVRNSRFLLKQVLLQTRQQSLGLGQLSGQRTTTTNQFFLTHFRWATSEEPLDFFVQELDEVWTVVSSEECVSWVEKQIELGKNFSSEW